MSRIDVYPQTISAPSDAKVVTGTEQASTKKVGLDVNVIAGSGVTGSFTLSGLRTDFEVTTQDVTDTAAKMPATPLTDRNSISIVNLSATDTLYIGKSTVTADSVIGTTSGWEVGPLEGFNTDITDEIELWGRAEAGKTVRIKILELA